MGCHFLLEGNIPDLGIKPSSLVPPALAGEFFTTELLGKPQDRLTKLYLCRNIGGQGNQLHDNCKVLRWVYLVHAGRTAKSGCVGHGDGYHVQMFAHKSHHTVIIHVSAVFLSTPSPGKVQYNVCCGEGILLALRDLNLDKCQPQCLL